MIKIENAPKKLFLAKQRIAELSNGENRLTASGNIDVKCGTDALADGMMMPEVLL